MKNNKLPHMDVGNGLTVWYFVVFLLELSWQCGILLFFMDVGTVLTDPWKTTKYHTVRTVPIEKKIPHCEDSSNIHEKQQITTLSGQFQ
jgi:hypothetical protein